MDTLKENMERIRIIMDVIKNNNKAMDELAKSRDYYLERLDEEGAASNVLEINDIIMMLITHNKKFIQEIETLGNNMGVTFKD